MTKTYIEWIDSQLEFHQTEVARLTIARGVVEEAATALDIMRHKPKAEPKPPKAPKTQPVTRVNEGDMWRTKIISHLAEHGPHDSNALIEAFGLSGKQGRQKVYNAVSKMRIDGLLDKTEEGVYSLPRTEELLKTGTGG